MTVIKDVKTTEYEEGHEQRVATFKASQMIWLLLGLLEAVLALRVIFKLIGVNATNSFATLLYNVSNFFVAPFASLIGAPVSGGMVLEISTIIAMVVYLLIFWGIERIVNVLFYRPRGDVSVRQTMVADNTPLQSTGVRQTMIADNTPLQSTTGVRETTTTTDRSTTAPMGTNQTVVTERTNTQTPR